MSEICYAIHLTDEREIADGTRAPSQPHLTKRVVFKSSIRIQTTWQLWLASGQLGWKDYPYEKYAMLD